MDASKKIEYQKLLMNLVPESGNNIGNVSLREQLQEEIGSLGDNLSDEDYWLLRDSLIDSGLIEQGRGRGGSVHRVRVVAPGTVVPAAPYGLPVERANGGISGAVTGDTINVAGSPA